jgi:hypothetical protein
VITDERKQPYPNSRWIGRKCSFDHAGKRLVGTVEEATFAGWTKRGAIPDWQLKIRGASGKTLTVSLVEAHTSFPES